MSEPFWTPLIAENERLARELAARDEALAALRAAAREYREAQQIHDKAHHAYMDLRLDGDATSWRARELCAESERTELELIDAEDRLLALLPADAPADVQS